MEVKELEMTTDLYLELMKGCLTRRIFPEAETYCPITRPSRRAHPLIWAVYPLVDPIFRSLGLKLFRRARFDAAERLEGRGWPGQAETMMGLKRLENLQYCATQVLQRNIPGDFIETGVWRGGATIFMRAVLKAYGDCDRTVWVADSFEGLPKPDSRYPQDAGDGLWTYKSMLGISLEQVKANFARYGLLDGQVRFLKGWFEETLPTAPIDRLAILRLDGDLYSSTIHALQNLYPKLSPGGYAIVDDYGSIPACKQAVDDFRLEHGITEHLEEIDWTGVFWEKRS